MRHLLHVSSIFSGAVAITLMVAVLGSVRVLGGVDPPNPLPCLKTWDPIFRVDYCPNPSTCPEGYISDWEWETDPWTGEIIEWCVCQ